MSSNIRVEVTNKVTVNIGNFQNQQPGYAISIDLDEGENPHEVRKKLKSVIDKWLEEDVTSIRNEMNA